MYRGTPYLNRQIKKKQQERSMQFHMNNLTHIRPRTGTIQYGQIQINNRKGQMQKQARFTQIQRENRILLEKISSIMGKHQTRKTQSQQKINRSLNSELRKRQMQNIQIQNAKLLKRLQDRKPNYETQKFKQSWRKQKYVIKNLSNYPFIINDRKRKRSSVSQIGGKQSRTSNVELCRMRIIDGVSFLVTVRLNHQRLQIIGDTKDKKQIKVIQIERNQAIQFIEQECGGKIQRIFECLRFDKNEEVMYLVASEVDADDIPHEGSTINKNSKRQQNPQFDISLDPEHQNLDKDQIQGQIPIRISNGTGNKKYWVEVQKKMQEKLSQKKQTQPKKQKTQSKQAQNQQYQQFVEQSKKQLPKVNQIQVSISNKKKQQKKQDKIQNTKRSQILAKPANKIQSTQSAVNTVPKLRKLPEQEQTVPIQSKIIIQQEPIAAKTSVQIKKHQTIQKQQDKKPQQIFIVQQSNQKQQVKQQKQIKVNTNNSDKQKQQQVQKKDKDTNEQKNCQKEQQQKPPSGYYDSDDEPWQIGDNNPIHYDQQYLDQRRMEQNNQNNKNKQQEVVAEVQKLDEVIQQQQLFNNN